MQITLEYIVGTSKMLSAVTTIITDSQPEISGAALARQGPRVASPLCGLSLADRRIPSLGLRVYGG